MPISIVVHGDNVNKYIAFRTEAEQELGKGATHNVVFGWILKQLSEAREEKDELKEKVDNLESLLEKKDATIEKALISSVSAPKFFGVQSNPRINTKIASFPQIPPTPNGPPLPPTIAFKERVKLEIIEEDEEGNDFVKELEDAVEYEREEEEHVKASIVWEKAKGEEYNPPPEKKKIRAQLKVKFDSFYFPRKKSENDEHYNERLRQEKRKIEDRKRDRRMYLAAKGLDIQ